MDWKVLLNIQEFIINTIPTHLHALHVAVALSCLQFVLAPRNWYQFPPQVETQPSLERRCNPYTLCYLMQSDPYLMQVQLWDKLVRRFGTSSLSYIPSGWLYRLAGLLPARYL